VQIQENYGDGSFLATRQGNRLVDAVTKAACDLPGWSAHRAARRGIISSDMARVAVTS